MRRFVLTLMLFVVVHSSATTVVTGKIKNLDTTTPGSKSFIRFWLRGVRGNQPRIPPTGAIAPQFSGSAFYVDLPADSSGNVSGTIYSTRDAAGTGAGDIEVSGSYTAVYYGMQIFNGGVPGPEIPIHAKSGGTLDIANVSAISTLPVVVAPNGDSTYARIDGGNTPFSGAVSFGAAMNATNGGSLGGTFSGNPTFSGSPIFSGSVGLASPTTTGADSGTETLSNKTFNAPIITNPSTTGTDSGTETLTNKTLTSPTSTGTDTGTETLTNKTLTSPAITNPSSTGTDSGTETLSNKSITSPVILTGIGNDGSGFKHKRFGATCSTAASVGSFCTTTFSWTTAFADANYTPTCTPVGPTQVGIFSVASFNAAGVTIEVVAGTAAAASFSGVNCSATHD